MNCKQAVILAGGAGTRLKAIAGARPKALTPVAGQPVIDHLIAEFLAAGVTDFLLLLGIGAEAIVGHVEQRWSGQARFASVTESSPRGTGGALLDAREHLQRKFFLCFGDVVFRTDLAALAGDLERLSADVMISVHPNDHPFDSDAVIFDEAGRVSALSVAPHAQPVRNRVNAGIYVMTRDVIERLAPQIATGNQAERLDLEKHIVAPAVQRYRVFARELIEYLRDVGTPERLALAEQDFALGVPQRLADPSCRAAFLISYGQLFEPNGTAKSEGIAALKNAVEQGLFPAVMVSGVPGLDKAALDTALGALGAFSWDYVDFGPESLDFGYLTRRLVAEQTVFMAHAP